MESWRSAVSSKLSNSSDNASKSNVNKKDDDDDDWETDPDFVNDVSEKEQRWGSKSIPGSGRGAAINIDELRKQVAEEDQIVKEKCGHNSEKDFKKGYGGQFGVDKDSKDASAVGWDYHQKLEKHASQKDYSSGFGGKFGVQSDRVDKSAVGWDYKEKSEKHESQKSIDPKTIRK